MLKQMELGLLLESQKRKLAGILGVRKAFEERKADIEKRMEDPATMTDEELAKAGEDLAALEKDVAEADTETKLAEAEAEIKRLEEELAKIGEKSPTADTGGGAAGGEPAEPDTEQRRKGDGNMNRRNTGRKMALRSRLAPYIERDDVKKWLEHFRSLAAASKRAVNGAELAVPTEILEPIRERIEEYSKLIKYVNFKPVKGKARQMVAGTIPDAVWTEMKGAINEADFAFNAVEVDGYKVAAFIPVPNSILKDSDLDLLVEIVEILGKAIGRGVDKAVIFASGRKCPLGIATRLTATDSPRDMGEGAPEFVDLSESHVGKLSSAGLTGEAFFSEVVLGLGQASTEYGDEDTLFWAMNPRTYAKLMSKVVTFNSAGAITAGITGEMPVVGGAIEKLGFMPDDVIVGGYGNLYLLAERESGNVTKSEHAQFIQDNTVFKGVGRYDGCPVIAEGFAIFYLNATGGTPTVTFPEDTANAEPETVSGGDDDTAET